MSVRSATTRGASAVRGFVMVGADRGPGEDPPAGLAAVRERAQEITEARGLASRDARLPLGGIADVAGAIARVRKAAALDASELVAVAATGQALDVRVLHDLGRAARAPRAQTARDGSRCRHRLVSSRSSK